MIVDTFPILLGATAAGMLLVVTYTSLGLAMSSVSTNGFFPAIGLLALVLGSKSVAFLVALIFEQDVLYLFSPYDALANVGQALVGTESNCRHPVDVVAGFRRGDERALSVPAGQPRGEHGGDPGMTPDLSQVGPALNRF